MDADDLAAASTGEGLVAEHDRLVTYTRHDPDVVVEREIRPG